MASKYAMLRRTIRRNYLPYLMVAPMAITMAGLILYPIARVVWMSLHDYYLARPGQNPFVGLANYVDVLQAFEFANAVKVTALYLIVTVPVRLVLALGVALLLNRPFKGRALARSIMIVPWALPVVIAGLVWLWLLGQDGGIINYALLKLGLISVPLGFLSSMDLALPSVILVNIWKGTPFIALMLLAGLQSIPHELYEAAKIDGASNWRSFLSITMPLLRPVSTLSTLLLVIWTMREFDLVYVMTMGGPARATELFTIYIYRSAFEGLRFGRASAAGVLLLLFSLAFTILFLKLAGGEDAA